MSDDDTSTPRPRCPIVEFLKKYWLLATAGLAWSTLMLTISVRSGVQHDYSAYLAIWDLIASGEDPWSTNNVYGPIFNVFAPLAYLFSLGPKLVFSLAFVLMTLVLAVTIASNNCGSLTLRMTTFALLIPINFLVIGIVFFYGLNDALVAALVGLAVLARYKGRLYWAGVLLGLACLLKFYPGVLIPFFCLDRRTTNLRVMYASLTVILAGMVASLLYWGSGIATAWQWIGQRSAGFLSLQAALERSPLALVPESVIASLDSFNVLLVLLAAFTALALAWWLKVTWLEGATLGLLMVLLVYKGGHQQQYLPWLVLAASLLIFRSRSAVTLALLSVPLAIFLSGFQIGFQFRAADQFALIGILPMDVGYAITIIGWTTVAAYVISTRWWTERLGRSPTVKATH